MTVQSEEGPVALTPDCVVQVIDSYGVVAEAKKHYRSAEDTSAFAQIAKYDQPMLGWWTPNEEIERHDLVLITHYMSATRACDAHKKWMSNGNSFERPFAIVEFNFSDQASTYFTLKRAAGSLSDRVHNEALHNPKAIPEHLVIELIRKYKFYDADPPDVHTMLLLHDYIFPMLHREEDFDALQDHEHPVLRITVEEAQTRLAEQFCDPPHKARQPRLPKSVWVRIALDRFVKLGLATCLPKEPDTFEIVLKKPRKKDTLEYFAERIVRLRLKADPDSRSRRAKKTKAAKGQLPLFSRGD